MFRPCGLLRRRSGPPGGGLCDPGTDPAWQAQREPGLQDARGCRAASRVRGGAPAAPSPRSGRGSAPPEVSPAARTPGLDATPARGSLTGPHHGRIRGHPSREGRRGGQRRHYAFARWPDRTLTRSLPPWRARTTRPGAEPGSTLKGQEPRRAPPGTGAVALWWWVTPIRPARDTGRAMPACGCAGRCLGETVVTPPKAPQTSDRWLGCQQSRPFRGRNGR